MARTTTLIIMYLFSIQKYNICNEIFKSVKKCTKTEEIAPKGIAKWFTTSEKIYNILYKEITNEHFIIVSQRFHFIEYTLLSCVRYEELCN